jgi:flavorubredoxin
MEVDMFQFRNVCEDVYWVGGNDRRLAVFEGVFHIPRGVSYNSYLVLDKKTVLLDTVDKAVGGVLLENLEALLKGRELDCLIVNHMEPDHCALIPELLLRYPKLEIRATALAKTLMKQFFDFDVDAHVVVCKEGDTFCSGRHNFNFVMAPMVHWPEVMVTYDSTDKLLFSADAFGTFGAIAGNLFADEVDFEKDWLADARRYYANIVGKYGPQVTDLLGKLTPIPVNMICPLHGPIWRRGHGGLDIDWYVGKYSKWASYTPEDKAVMIAYASVYGDTAALVDILAGKLAERGVKNIAVYDVSVTDSSQIVSESFRCSHLVFASTTYNMGIFIKMEEALLDLEKHNLQNRKVALIENGSWAPASGRLMAEIFGRMKNIEFVADRLTIKSALQVSQLAQVDALADAIVSSM